LEDPVAKKHDLFKTLRAAGLRKKVAASLSDAAGRGSRSAKQPKAVRDAARELRALASTLEDRATGRTAKRSAAAKQAAATRRRKAAKRSAAAKKGARTRAASR
jgi:hypothetical protein